MKDKFSEAEQQGREIVLGLISGHCRNYEFTKGKYDNVDLFLTGVSGTQAVMEIKNRTGYTSYDIDQMGGHIFEYPKFTALTSYDTYKPIYTVCYPDVCLMWDVSTITDDNFVEVKNKYPSTTVTHGDKTTKKVTYLQRDKAYIMKRNEQVDREDSEGKDGGEHNSQHSEEHHG